MQRNRTGKASDVGCLGLCHGYVQSFQIPSSKANGAVTGIVTVSTSNKHVFQNFTYRQQTENKSLVPEGTLACHTDGEAERHK